MYILIKTHTIKIWQKRGRRAPLPYTCSPHDGWWNVHKHRILFSIFYHNRSIHISFHMKAAYMLVNQNCRHLNSNRALITGCPINNIRNDQEKHNYATFHTLKSNKETRSWFNYILPLVKPLNTCTYG